jgi:hypothetical protein
MTTHPYAPLHTLLMQLASIMRDLCQRQIDQGQLLDSLDLTPIVDRLLREHGLEPDFDQQFSACVNCMSQDDAVGQTLVFDRCDSNLRMQQVEASMLLDTDVQAYEMVLFDGGNTHGDRWKHAFFPAQRAHYFVSENF